jgi:hypothetical protein
VAKPPSSSLVLMTTKTKVLWSSNLYYLKGIQL